jgi:hypothetical protein
MVQVELKLTGPQMKKVMANKAIQLSHSNLVNPTGEHVLKFDASKILHNKLLRSASKGKGIRIPAGVASSAVMEGDGVEGGNIGRAFKRFGKKMKRGFQKLGNDLKPAVPVLKTIGRELKPIGKEVLKAVVEKGLPMATSALGSAAGAYVGGPTGALIGKELGEAGGKAAASEVNKKISGLGNGRWSKPRVGVAPPPDDNFHDIGAVGGRRYRKQGASSTVTPSELVNEQQLEREHTTNANKKKTHGNGVGRPAKGSQEAKDRMARLRSLRKTKGDGFGSVLSKVGKKVASKVVDKAIDKGTTMAVNSVLGEGLVKTVRHRKIKEPTVVKVVKATRVKNPRIKIPFATLNNGIDQVSGSGYAGWNYA